MGLGEVAFDGGEGWGVLGLELGLVVIVKDGGFHPSRWIGEVIEALVGMAWKC